MSRPFSLSSCYLFVCIVHSILGTLLGRLNLTPILNVPGVCSDGNIWNAEEAPLEYMSYFEAVEMLHPSLRQQPLNSCAQSALSAPGGHHRPQLASHKKQTPAGSPNFAIEA